MDGTNYKSKVDRIFYWITSIIYFIIGTFEFYVALGLKERILVSIFLGIIGITYFALGIVQIYMLGKYKERS